MIQKVQLISIILIFLYILNMMEDIYSYCLSLIIDFLLNLFIYLYIFNKMAYYQIDISFI